ncbi:MAG TPA: glycerol-3-phosphate dehydrogenase [Steroidobacteraceae bacterium]
MLGTEPFDLLVIGGGINGTGIARDAVGRGLRVALVEQADLGAFTSSASTKLIHGGLRYLEYGEFRLVRESLAERERLLAIAPHIVHPLRLVLPHSSQQRPRWMIRLGLFAYDHLGGRTRLPSSTRIRLSHDPAGVALRSGFEHAFSYSDCTVDDSRLVVLNAIDAAQRGATILTRTRLIGAAAGTTGWLAECQDTVTGHKIHLHARVLVNAAAAWVNQVRATLGFAIPQPVRLVQGSHIVVPRLFAGEHAFLLQNSDKRVVFAIPYAQRYTLVGTTDIPFHGNPCDIRISAAEIAYLCETVNRYFKQSIAPADVAWSYSGTRALYDDGATEAAAVTRDYVLKLERGAGGNPVLSIIGGKITTYRRLAEAVLRALQPWVANASAGWTDKQPLPGGDVPRGDFAAFARDVLHRWPFLPPATAHRMARAYGTRMERILGAANSLEMLGENLGGGLTAAEVDYLQREEWASTAEDILWRRSKLGLAIAAGATRRLELYLQTAHRAHSPGAGVTRQ